MLHWRRSSSVIEPSDEGEEQVEQKQKSTPCAIMKHWNCDDTSNDIVLYLNLLIWLERAIVLPLWFDATLNVICNYFYLCKQGSCLKIYNIYISRTGQEDVGNIKLIEEFIVSMATTVDNNGWFQRSASS